MVLFQISIIIKIYKSTFSVSLMPVYYVVVNISNSAFIVTHIEIHNYKTVIALFRKPEILYHLV